MSTGKCMNCGELTDRYEPINSSGLKYYECETCANPEFSVGLNLTYAQLETVIESLKVASDEETGLEPVVRENAKKLLKELLINHPIQSR